MSEEKHELEELIDALMRRDKNTVEELNQKSFWGGSPSIEDRIFLADGRALDALSAVMTIARYIMEKEKEKGTQ